MYNDTPVQRSYWCFYCLFQLVRPSVFCPSGCLFCLQADSLPLCNFHNIDDNHFTFDIEIAPREVCRLLNKLLYLIRYARTYLISDLDLLYRSNG